MSPRTFILAGLLPLFLACGRVSNREAKALVTRYNAVVCEAYRQNDIRLIDSVVGAKAPDGTRLTGLIGVRMDMGLILDAKLETLEVTKVDQAPEDLRVGTREQWHYRDLKADTRQQVGQASTDRYEVLYHFKKEKGVWMVEDVQFTAPPQVGRQNTPWKMDVRDAHGLPSASPAPGPEQGATK